MNIDSTRQIAANMSTALKISPLNMNIPFRNRRPAQNKAYDGIGVMPKTNIRRAIPAAKSMEPRTFSMNM